MKNLTRTFVKKITTLLILLAILLPQLVLAVNTHTADLEKSSSQYFTVADSADFGWGANRTITFWANPESDPAADTEYKILAQSATNQRWGQIIYQTEAGVQKFQWHTYNQCSDTGLTETLAKINYDMTVGTWYHIAFVGTGTSWELFVNGVSQGTATIDQQGNCSADWYIGARQGGDAEFFDGKLDDFRIYPTTALTGSQILADYNCELSDFTNLTVYYQFNNSANEVAGVGAATDNLTAVNTPTYQTADLPFTAACGAAAVAAPTHPLIWNMF